MLNTFKELMDTYAYKELEMGDLRLIQSSGIVSFDNHGISRSNTDCLLCVLTYEDLFAFKQELLSCSFDSYARYEAFILDSGFDLKRDPQSQEDYIIHKSDNGFYEIACSIGSDGKVSIDSEDIKLQEKFNIYLRVQHASSKV